VSNASKRQLKRRQRRKRKLKHLRRQLEATTDAGKRRHLIAKIRRISPTAPVPET
jgi:hypothetical protein